ncbi:RAB6-interacting golgin isoform X1 [Ictidomys tridecemlineatus]|uniref:RAB6-interacting golgin n=1 Tax=Ictidomys tridecemlineatus TaxID=43179 RepID=I3MV54_ICTTR|nr:RAB6-interacting golgin isoform X1 [Ictidomys tridecemlineatus]KAG3258761.1 golgin, RAB6 interacting, transcript variant X1 [Ictidomys tridecemlineatus]
MCRGRRAGSPGFGSRARLGCRRPGPMARDWAGFSEEELRRLKQNKDPFEPQRRLPGKKTRQQFQREKALLELSQRLGLQDGSASLSPEQLLSAPKQRLNTQEPHSSSPTLPSPLTLSSPVGDGKPQGIKSQSREPGLENSHDGHKNVEVLPPKPDCKLEKKKVELQEKSRWEILQQEQRLMEEKNKRKKALLAKAIAERSKRTQAETMKLKRIQKELQALDDMVSADIGILRNRIDQASLDYSYAQKRFDRAEAEYITAKLDLQRKTEIKEQLTEHLCTIIQQNELRKAKKLEELMQQLDVQADEETLELEVEVERLLREQEAEAGKRVAFGERPCQSAEESATLQFVKEDRKPQEQSASLEVGEQCGSSSRIPCVSPDCPNQGVNDMSAAMAT